MSLTGFLKLLSGRSGGTGLFAYLTSRNTNKNRVELEKARQETSTALIGQLPNGAVFRESTSDGWREIWMPPLQGPQVIFFPAADGEPVSRTASQDAVMDQNQKAIGGEVDLEPDCASDA